MDNPAKTGVGAGTGAEATASASRPAFGTFSLKDGGANGSSGGNGKFGGGRAGKRKSGGMGKGGGQARRVGRDDHEDSDNDGEEGQRELVTSIGADGIQGAEVKEEKGHLVIPVASNPWQKKGLKANGTANGSGERKEEKEGTEGKEKEKSLDELAAEALVREVGGASQADNDFGLGLNSTRVIALQPGGGAAEEGGGEEGSTQKKGILASSMIPGLNEVEGDDAKFKHDLSMRAEDLDVKSSAYQSVPIEEFGAALLRGMGWAGPNKEDEERLVGPASVRHHRLGLGAQPKPPEQPSGGKGRKGKKDLKAEAEEAAWKEKAEAAARQQKVTIGDVVVVRKGRMASKRGMVLRTRGQGLGEGWLLVRMEEGGKEEEIEKGDVMKVEEDEKAKNPFRIRSAGEKEGGAVSSSSGGESRRKDMKRRSSRSRSTSRSRSRSKGRRRDRDRDRYGDRERGREREREREGGRDGRKSGKDRKKRDRRSRSRSRSRGRRRSGSWEGDGGSSSGDGGGGRERKKKRRREDRKEANDHGGKGGSREDKKRSWLVPKIRVRVISKAYGREHRLAKGVVLDVPAPDQGTVRMDSGSLLEGVKVGHLETVLPPGVGGKVIVLRGEDVGLTGKVVEKQLSRERVIVQLHEEMRIITRSPDDVAEFTGMLDADMDDAL